MSSLLLLIGQLTQAVPGLAPRGDLVRRIDSLDRTIGQLSAELKAGERLEPSDTVEVGRFRLALDHRDRDRFVPVATEVSREWESLFGPAAPRLYLKVATSPWSRTRTVSVQADSNGPVVGAALIHWTEVRRGLPDGAVRRAVWDAIGGVLLERADSGLRAWLPLAPVGRSDVYDADDLAYQWVTAFGPASAGCREGNRDQCVRALGLGGPVDREFTIQTRAAFLAYLLETSAPGGWARLERSAGQPMAARLSAVAGMDIGSAIMAWRQGRLDRRRGHWDDPWRWAMAGLWGVVAVGVAVGGGMRR